MAKWQDLAPKTIVGHYWSRQENFLRGRRGRKHQVCRWNFDGVCQTFFVDISTCGLGALLLFLVVRQYRIYFWTLILVCRGQTIE